MTGGGGGGGGGVYPNGYGLYEPQNILRGATD